MEDSRKRWWRVVESCGVKGVVHGMQWPVEGAW